MKVGEVYRVFEVTEEQSLRICNIKLAGKQFSEQSAHPSGFPALIISPLTIDGYKNYRFIHDDELHARLIGQLRITKVK